MNRATIARKIALATVTTIVMDGRTYYHNPATVGHAKHTAACWTLRPEFKPRVVHTCHVPSVSRTCAACEGT